MRKTMRLLSSLSALFLITSFQLTVEATNGFKESWTRTKEDLGVDESAEASSTSDINSDESKPPVWTTDDTTNTTNEIVEFFYSDADTYVEPFIEVYEDDNIRLEFISRGYATYQDGTYRIFWTYDMYNNNESSIFYADLMRDVKFMFEDETNIFNENFFFTDINQQDDLTFTYKDSITDNVQIKALSSNKMLAWLDFPNGIDNLENIHLDINGETFEAIDIQ